MNETAAAAFGALGTPWRGLLVAIRLLRGGQIPAGLVILLASLVWPIAVTVAIIAW